MYYLAEVTIWGQDWGMDKLRKHTTPAELRKTLYLTIWRLRRSTLSANGVAALGGGRDRTSADRRTQRLRCAREVTL